jgi:hypothetical protein
MSLFGKQYPENVHIDDWQQPWLPLPVRLFNRIPDSLAKNWFKFDEASLFEAAKKNTGLADFGDTDFLVPFRVLQNDLQKTANFTAIGRLTVLIILLQQLQSRLCVENKLRDNPGIAAQKITSPVFIAGLPRTGTTHLHNLLSEVHHLRYMPLWQTLEPVRNPKHKVDHRRRNSDFSMRMTNYIIPLFRRMHEMVTDMPHEELTICALGYRSFFFEGTFQVPGYRQWYTSQSHEKGYEYLKRTLQILQTEAAPGNKTTNARWVLKSPQHVDQLQTIINVFPDAKIILTHRDPARAVLSMITMMLYTSRQVYKPTRLREEATAWVERLEQMLRRSREQAKQLPSSQVMDVHFDQFMKAPEQTIRDVLHFAGIPYDTVSEAAIMKHLHQHARDQHGRIDYHFEDFGLSENEVRERFAFYQP